MSAHNTMLCILILMCSFILGVLFEKRVNRLSEMPPVIHASSED